MTKAPTPSTWFPSSVNVQSAETLATIITQVAKQVGFTRETFAVALTFCTEALVGHEPAEDIDIEVLGFVANRLSATADAISGGAN
jgi:hypothetical protein